MKIITKIATLVALSLMVTATVNAQGNILFDAIGESQAGFEIAAEDGSADGWKASADGFYGRTTDMAYEGDASMKVFLSDDIVSGTTYNSSILVASTGTMTFEQDKVYKFSYYIYIDEVGSEKLSAISIAKSSTWLEISKIQTSTIEKGQWVKVETGEYTYTGETQASAITIKLFCNGGSETVDVSCYIDNVEVIDVEAYNASVSTSVESAVKVIASNGGVTVNGAEMGASVDVYAMTGAKVVSSTITSNSVFVPIAPKGIYIVKVGDDVVKVAL